jgi:hypothetical protein
MATAAESKRFHVLDGHGIRLWQRTGCRVALLSGRHLDCLTNRRAEQLQIALRDAGLPGHEAARPGARLLAESGTEAAQNVAYVGDDLMDLPPIRARRIRRGRGQCRRRGQGAGGLCNRQEGRRRSRTGGHRIHPQRRRPLAEADGTL